MPLTSFLNSDARKWSVILKQMEMQNVIPLEMGK